MSESDIFLKDTLKPFDLQTHFLGNADEVTSKKGQKTN
jgi:hypothetical protein